MPAKETLRRMGMVAVAGLFAASLLFSRAALAALSTASSTSPSIAQTTTASTGASSTSSTPIFVISTPIQNTPFLSSIAAASTTATTTLITWATQNQVSDSEVFYGTSTDYTATSTGDLALDHSVFLGGLSPGTTYHFKVSSANGFGTVASADQTFTTAPAPSPSDGAPDISGIIAVPAYSIAAISWTTDQPASSEIAYGPTPLYGSIATGTPGLAQTMATNHVVSIAGLTPDTTYHFVVVSTTSSGMSATSTDQTFTTAAAPTG